MRNVKPGERNLPIISQNHEIRFPLYTQSKEHGNHQQDPQKVLFQDRPQGCNLRSHRNKFRLTKISVRFQRKLEIAKGGHLIPPFFVDVAENKRMTKELHNRHIKNNYISDT